MATLAAGNVILLDLMAAALTLAGPLAVLQLFDELAKQDLLEKMLSRKLVHILAGLVFMLPWPLFSMSPYAKYMAAFAVAANGLCMIGLGLGLLKNDALVQVISREGDKSLVGQWPPLVWDNLTLSWTCSHNVQGTTEGATLLHNLNTVATVSFWRNSLLGAVAVANLCAGDGFADIVGRNYGTEKLQYNHSKSYIGSLAFFAAASIASMRCTLYFASFGYFETTSQTYLTTIAVSLCAAIVESLPLPIDDNLTVTFIAIAVGMLLLPY